MQQDPARWVDPDLVEHARVLQWHLDGLADLLDLLVEATDVLVVDAGALGDLHHASADVRLVVQRLDDREGVVYGDAFVRFEVLAHLLGDLGEGLLVVAVLFDNDPFVGQLLDRRHEQGGLLEFLVLVGEPFELLLIFVVLGVRVQQLVPHLLVLLLENLELFL